MQNGISFSRKKTWEGLEFICVTLLCESVGLRMSTANIATDTIRHEHTK